MDIFTEQTWKIRSIWYLLTVFSCQLTAGSRSYDCILLQKQAFTRYPSPAGKRCSLRCTPFLSFSMFCALLRYFQVGFVNLLVTWNRGTWPLYLAHFKLSTYLTQSSCCSNLLKLLGYQLFDFAC